MTEVHRQGPLDMLVGHEFVGRVVATGSRVKVASEGDVVSGEGHIVCGQCRHCRAGRRHLCVDVEGVGVTRSGAFADYLTLPASNVWVHEEDLDRDVQAIFDPYGNAAHTALRFPVLAEDVLITGAGPIGCMAAAVARFAGARNVVVTDRNPTRLELARRMGADLAVDTRETSLQEVIRQLDMQVGFDVAMEMSGSPAALREAIDHMCHGGCIALLGIPSAEAAIDWRAVVFEMLTIQGIYGREMFDTWWQMSAMLHAGLDIAPVITHRLAAEDHEQGFAAMADGSAGKVVLTWNDG